VRDFPPPRMDDCPAPTIAHARGPADAPDLDETDALGALGEELREVRDGADPAEEADKFPYSRRRRPARIEPLP
jgi:hypothetical protein